jgi:pimeloyl-ACP methyl ester carboxylesterase
MMQSMIASMRDIIEVGGELSLSKAGNITCPVLLISGEHDIFATPALTSELAARIHAAEVLATDGAEHFVYIGCPEWLTYTILDWMGKH